MKKRILIPTLALCSAASMVAPLATSCSKNNSVFTRYDALGGEYDKEYNVNEATYKALKGEFFRQYELKLRNDPAHKDDEVYIRKAKANLSKDLSKFDTKLLANKHLSYTVITSTMVDFAAKKYGVKLVRNTTVQEGDFQKLIEGLCNSFDLYMLHLNFDAKIRAEILSKAKNQFSDLLDELNDEYADPLMKLIHAKSRIALCFADINTDIALWAANVRLQQFLSEYRIELNNDEEGRQVRLDNVKTWTWTNPDGSQQAFQEGADLTGIMDKLFVIIRNSDESDTPIEFENELLPGYTLIPVLKTISENPDSNTYAITIDWRCVKTSYLTDKSPEEIEEATAHLRDLRNAVTPAKYYESPYVEEGELKDITAVDIVKDAPIVGVSYPIFLTPEKEKQALKDTYFNKSSSNQALKYIDLKWDDNEEVDPSQRLDYAAFFQGEELVSTDDREHYNIDAKALGNAGLTIAAINKFSSNDEVEYTRLQDIMGNGIYTPSNRSVNGEDEEQVDELISQFIENCDLTAETSILDNSSHDVKVTAYATYKNTLEANGDSTRLAIDENLDNVGTPLGSTSYYSLTQTYNNLLQYERKYTENVYEDILDDLKDELILTFAFFQLGVTLNGICMAGMFVEPPKIGFFIALMFLSIASDTCQGIIFYLFIHNKYDPTLRYADNCKALQESSEGRSLVEMLKKDALDANLLEANEDMTIDQDTFNAGLEVYKQKQWEGKNGIKQLVERYTKIKDNPTFVNFKNKVDELDVSQESYKAKMSPWNIKGAYWAWSLGLDLFSLGLDITAVCVSGATPPATPPAQGRVTTRLETQQARRFSQAEIDSFVKQEDAFFRAQPMDTLPKRVQNLPEAEFNELKSAESLPQRGSEAAIDGEWDLPIGYKFQKFYKQPCPEYGTQDLLQAYGMDEFKLLETNYGGKGVCIKNLINELRAVDENGIAKVPLGPEILDRMLSREETEIGSIKNYLKNVLYPAVDGKLDAELFHSIPHAIDKIDDEVRNIDDIADALQRVWDDIRVDFPTSPFGEFKVANPPEGDGYYSFFSGAMFRAFSQTWTDVYDSIMVHLKLLRALPS